MNIDSMASAEEAQARGNAAFTAGNFTDAVRHYTEAITLSPSNHLLYCDRSAAYASLDNFLSALSDAQKAVQLDGSWPACHSRLGAAYLGLHDYSKSISAYQDGLRFAPSNEGLTSGLAKATAAQSLAPFGVPLALHQQPLRIRMLRQRRQLMTQYQFTAQQQQQQANMLRGQQSARKAGDGKAKLRTKVRKPTSSTEGQIIGSSKTVLLTGVRPLHSNCAPSVTEMVTSKKQKLAADACDLCCHGIKLTENMDLLSNVQPLWTSQSKERHTNMASLNIQGLRAPVAVHEALKQAREYLEKAKALKKAKEVNDTLAQKNLELEESVKMLQTRVKELENNKMREDHDQLIAGLKNLELEESASTLQTRVKELENELTKTSEDHLP